MECRASPRSTELRRPCTTGHSVVVFGVPQSVENLSRYDIIRLYIQMFARRIGWELAILGVVCVLAVFLFPSMSGPYTAVHGPVTAMRSARAAARLRVAIVPAALSALGNNRISSLLIWPCSASLNEVFPLAVLPENNTILRC